MRPSFLARLGFVLGSTLSLWLLSAPIVDAAPISRRHARVSRALYEARPAPRRIRARAPDEQSPARSVRYLLRTHPRVSRHVSAWLERRRASPLRDNEAAALQNSTAALGGEDDQLLLSSLEPLGVLTAACCPVTIRATVAPRSPRGPPVVTCAV
jgi:hypothetical protein